MHGDTPDPAGRCLDAYTPEGKPLRPHGLTNALVFELPETFVDSTEYLTAGCLDLR